MITTICRKYATKKAGTAVSTVVAARMPPLAKARRRRSAAATPKSVPTVSASTAAPRRSAKLRNIDSTKRSLNAR